jgi:hypothetical protein
MKMKKIILLIITVAVNLCSYAQQDHDHQSINKNITPYHDAQDATNNIHGLRFNQQAAWKKFVAKYPSWGCKFDAITGMPHRAFGEPIIYGNGDAVNRAKQFLTTAFADYQIPMQDLVVTLNKNDGKYINVNFKQIHNGKEVLFSRVTVRFTQDLKIMMVGVDAYNNIPNLQASLSEIQAIDAAKNAIATTIIDASANKNLKIIAIPEEGKMIFKLVYEVIVNSQDEVDMPGKYYTLVDANSGAIIYRQNKVNQIGSHVQGFTWDINKFSPLLPKPLANAEVLVGGTTYTTNAQGDITFPGNSPVTGTISLKGPWCRVVSDATGTVTPSYSATFNGGDTISYDTTAAAIKTTKVNAFRHVNEIHDFMNLKLPSFVSLNNQLLTRVDRTDGSCNAFYNGTSINFYEAGGGCTPIATIADVVYHEYGHGINDQYWSENGSSFDNGGMGEGYADVWAMSIINSPIIGAGFYANSATNGIRRYDTDNKVYPKDIVGEVHADGEIIAGAWWDVNVNWGNLDSTSSLFANSTAGLATGPDGTEGKVYFDILIDALTYDDNDANINNGTPHFLPIVNAFAKHGIYLLAETNIKHSPYPKSVAANSPAPITVDVTVSYPAFLGDIKLYYRLKKVGLSLVDTLTLSVVSANTYSVNFPAKLQGQIFEYYLAVFNSNLMGLMPASNSTAPTNAQFTIYSLERNIPYYIVFGMQSFISQDFETSTTGWDITLPSPQDNATAGKWIVANPIGSKINNVQVQTDKDHTSGTGKCAVTGNATSSVSAAGSADVDAGRTSIQSPIFNLTNFKNPVVSYWRWFTNSQSATNPRKDLWKVYISENGGKTYNLYTDRTYEPDVSWRRQIAIIKDVKLGFQLDSVRFLFVALDSNISAGGTLIEAAIDDFEIYDLAAPTAISDINMVADIYPNPTDNIVNISLGQIEKQVSISMVDATGKVVHQQNIFNTNSANINTRNIAAGIYFLRLSADNKQSVYKLVVQH